MTLGAFDTHEVLNQPPPYPGRNLFAGDPLLKALVRPGTEADGGDELMRAGQFWGSPEAHEMARLANEFTPVLKTHDSQGRRADVVEYHPAYHALMRRSVDGGLTSAIWTNGGSNEGHKHLARAGRFYVTAQTEAGHLCPITMTSASLAGLRAEPELFKQWAAGVANRKYDQRFLPAEAKQGVLLGMGMTEKQGGTDVRANTTAAKDLGDGTFSVTGHKWFMSAPMSDAFLILAQSDGGLTCFLLPRFRPDGSINGIRIQRLKNKLGNRSNASSEAEFHDALAFQVGETGKGVRTIIQMVTLTRLDCAVASAGLMRAAVARAVHHATHRRVFDTALIDAPLMLRTLADLSLDTAAATALALRLAKAFDSAATDPAEAAYARLITPAAKYWVCKSAPSVIYEAMECLGGNGYVEDADIARIYREAPVNAIWEGSGNVMCLDVLRVVSQDFDVLDKVTTLLAGDLGSSGPVSVDVLRVAAKTCAADEGAARILTEQLALTAAAAALRQAFPGPIADAFVETRLGGQWRSTYGMLDARFDAKAIVTTAYPAG